MSNIARSLAWAGVIIGAALVMRSQGMSDPARAGLALGLAGAGWGNLLSDTPCGRGCLQ